MYFLYKQMSSYYQKPHKPVVGETEYWWNALNYAWQTASSILNAPNVQSAVKQFDKYAQHRRREERGIQWNIVYELHKRFLSMSNSTYTETLNQCFNFFNEKIVRPIVDSHFSNMAILWREKLWRIQEKQQDDPRLVSGICFEELGKNGNNDYVLYAIMDIFLDDEEKTNQILSYESDYIFRMRLEDVTIGMPDGPQTNQTVILMYADGVGAGFVKCRIHDYKSGTCTVTDTKNEKTKYKFDDGKVGYIALVGRFGNAERDGIEIRGPNGPKLLDKAREWFVSKGCDMCYLTPANSHLMDHYYPKLGFQAMCMLGKEEYAKAYYVYDYVRERGRINNMTITTDPPSRFEKIMFAMDLTKSFVKDMAMPSGDTTRSRRVCNYCRQIYNQSHMML